MFTISPLLNFSLGLCISLEVVNEIKFEELALTKGAFDSLRGGLSLGLGNGDWVMGMWSNEALSPLQNISTCMSISGF